MAKDGFLVLDSDIHVFEPPDLWERYLEERFRDRAPQPAASRENYGIPRWLIEGRLVPANLTVAQGEKDTNVVEGKVAHRYKEAMARNFDAISQLQAMDVEGLDMAVLFRTGPPVGIEDLEPGYATALYRAYNTWLVDFCTEDPRRMKAVCHLELHDVDLAVQEVRRAVEELGMVGVCLLPNPVKTHQIHDPYYQPFWAQAEELGVPVCFHPGSGLYYQHNIGTRFMEHPNYRSISHAVSTPLELMMAITCMTLGGVLERFPTLRMAFLEGNCSWLPWLLYRLDEHAELFGQSGGVQLQGVPSELFRRQCFVSVDPDEELVQDVVEHVGDDNLVFSTDYPHAVETFLSLETIGQETKRKVLWDNCARLYNMERP